MGILTLTLHNIIENEGERVSNNRITHYDGVKYRYDDFGNVTTRILPSGEAQHYTYNLKDQLIKATIEKPNEAQAWHYDYDVIGRLRILIIMAYGGGNPNDKSIEDTEFITLEYPRINYSWFKFNLGLELNPPEFPLYVDIEYVEMAYALSRKTHLP